MRALSTVGSLCIVCLLASPPAPARVTSEPQGRQPQPRSRLMPQKLWTDQTGAFALERPTGDRWSFRADARGPDGETLPLVAQSIESGAQLIVQNADGVTSLRTLARMLADHLGTESGVRVQELEKLQARGGEAYGFFFTVTDEARGRVAVVRAGDHIALVIASWPMGAPATVLDDVDSMIATLGPVPGALPPNAF
jgi:hypothetical protein